MTVQASTRGTIRHCLMETLDGERRNVVYGGKKAQLLMKVTLKSRAEQTRSNELLCVCV